MQETLGQRLKRAREARYITLEKASADTHIRTVFLQALEADDYSVMPSAAQGRGFLRNYSEYLSLNIDEIIAGMQRNAPAPTEVSGPLPQVNLVETEVPPLTDSDDEKTGRPFWVRWFGRRSKIESIPVADPTEPAEEETPEPIEEVETAEQPKTRGRKKKKVEEEPPQQVEVTKARTEAETSLIEEKQVEVENGAQPGFFSRFASIFRIDFKRKQAESNSEQVTTEEIEEELKTPPPPSLPADVILAEIGAQLRERRQLISLTVDEVERHTRLRAVFVKALEDGSFDKLPSTVQTRGMLSNYATFLDLDVDVILLRFADALQARRHEKYAETPREKIQTQVTTSMPFLRTFIAGDLIFGVVMIAILIVLAIWGVGHVVTLRDEQAQAQPTAPSIVEVLGDLPEPTASLESTFVAGDDPLLATPAGGEVPPTLDAPAAGTNANVTVTVFALERVFVRISVDGEVVFEGRMAPRETKVFDADDQVVVLTGNGSAVRITYNGRDLGLLGGVGEVVSRVYLVSGVATPTATLPPTPTNTPLVTPTFTPSITPTPTTAPSE